MKRFYPLPRARGFTLIELAVVVLIIALIAGVALPTFFRHRERATDRTMISDLVSANKLALTYYMDRLGGKGSFSGFDPDSEPEWSSNITWGAPLADGQIGVISTSRNDRTWTLIQVAQPVDTDAGTIPVGTWVGKNTPDTWPDLDTVASHIDADGDGAADLDPDITTNLLTRPDTTSGAAGGTNAGDDGPSYSILTFSGVIASGPGVPEGVTWEGLVSFEGACVENYQKVGYELSISNTSSVPAYFFDPTPDQDGYYTPTQLYYIVTPGFDSWSVAYAPWIEWSISEGVIPPLADSGWWVTETEFLAAEVEGDLLRDGSITSVVETLYGSPEDPVLDVFLSPGETLRFFQPDGDPEVSTFHILDTSWQNLLELSPEVAIGMPPACE